MATLTMALATSKDHQDSEPNFYTCLPNTEYYITAVFLGWINFKSPPLLTFPQTRKGTPSAITIYQWIQRRRHPRTIKTVSPNTLYYIMAFFLGRINFKSPPSLTFPQTRKGTPSAITTYQWIQLKVESLCGCVF